VQNLSYRPSLNSYVLTLIDLPVNCSGEFEYCGGKGENKTCTCLFGQDENNGSCRLPVDGTKCKGREREEENPHRGKILLNSKMLLSDGMS